MRALVTDQWPSISPVIVSIRGEGEEIHQRVTVTEMSCTRASKEAHLAKDAKLLGETSLPTSQSASIELRYSIIRRWAGWGWPWAPSWPCKSWVMVTEFFSITCTSSSWWHYCYLAYCWRPSIRHLFAVTLLGVLVLTLCLRRGKDAVFSQACFPPLTPPHPTRNAAGLRMQGLVASSSPSALWSWTNLFISFVCPLP